MKDWIIRNGRDLVKNCLKSKIYNHDDFDENQNLKITKIYKLGINHPFVTSNNVLLCFLFVSIMPKIENKLINT